MDGIDFVITWVDDSDPAWRKRKNDYRKRENGDCAAEREDCDDREERYRDFGLLRYWFRGVEQYAPWVRQVHLITEGHLPGWLKADAPKLHVVRHDEFIPAEYLPTFNSNAIEIFMHRICGLSEQFVYFNDDMLFFAPVRPDDFFRGGLPCDMLAFQPVVANPANPVMSYIYLNNSVALSAHFAKRSGMKEHPADYFHPGYPPLYFFYNLLELVFPKYTGFYNVHGPAALCRETFAEVWEKEEEAMRQTAQNRFRSRTDISIYLLRDWQKLTHRFVPKNVQRMSGYYELGRDDDALLRAMGAHKKKILCINDANVDIDYEGMKARMEEALARIFPQKSSFEQWGPEVGT